MGLGEGAVSPSPGVLDYFRRRATAAIHAFRTCLDTSSPAPTSVGSARAAPSQLALELRRFRTRLSNKKASLRLAAVTGGLVVVFAACNISHHAAGPAGSAAAQALCEKALGHRVVAAMLTTVAEARAWEMGGPAPLSTQDAVKRRPARNAWPTASSSEPAAWCTSGSDGDYTSYAVGPDGTAVRLVSVSGYVQAPAVGPPAIP